MRRHSSTHASVKNRDFSFISGIEFQTDLLDIYAKYWFGIAYIAHWYLTSLSCEMFFFILKLFRVLHLRRKLGTMFIVQSM